MNSENDTWSLQIAIGEKILDLKVDQETLKKAGGYFTGLLSNEYQESNTKTIKLESDSIYPGLEEDDWKNYFSLVFTEDGKVDIVKMQSLLIISRYFSNSELFESLEEKLKTEIKDGQLNKFLQNWIYYYGIMNTFVDRDNIEKWKNFFKIIGYKLKYFNVEDDFKSLLTAGQDIIDLVKDDPSIESLNDYFTFFSEWWLVVQDTIDNHHIYTVDKVINSSDDENVEDTDQEEREEHEGLEEDEECNSLEHELYTNFNFLFDPYQFKHILKYNILSEYQDVSSDKIFKDCVNFGTYGFYKTEPNFKDGESVIIDKITDERWQALTLGLLDDLSWWDNMILAGGSVNKLLNPKVNEFGPNVDLDLFLIGNKTVQARTLSQILSLFLLKYDSRLYLGTKQSVIYMWIEGIPRTIQIISSKAKSIFEVLNRFDLSHCQMAYSHSQKKFYCTSQAIFCLLTGTTHQVSKNYFPPLYRLLKACKSGYSLNIQQSLINQYIKLQQDDPDHFDDMVQRYHYNWYLPNSDVSDEEITYKLHKHYPAEKIYFGENIRINNIIETTNFCTDFKSSPYSKSSIVNINFSKLNIDTRKPTQVGPVTIFRLTYNDQPLVYNLPKSTCLFAGASLTGEIRNIVLKIDRHTHHYLFSFDRQFLDLIYQNKDLLNLIYKNKNRFRKLILEDIRKLILEDSYYGLVKESIDHNKIRYTSIRLKIIKDTEIINGYTNEKFTGDLHTLRNREMKVETSLSKVWVGDHGRFGLVIHANKIIFYPTMPEVTLIT